MSKEITVEEFYKGFETFIKNNEEKYRTGTPLDIITEKGIPKQQMSVFIGKSKLPSMMEDYIKSLNQKKMSKEELIEEILDIIHSENSGLSTHQRVSEIEKILHKTKRR
jgi:hypothetical protein